VSITRTGREVDFIVPVRGRPRMLVQVCASLADPQTRKRETAALSEAMAELGLAAGTIVTRNEDERTVAVPGPSTWSRHGSSSLTCRNPRNSCSVACDKY